MIPSFVFSQLTHSLIDHPRVDIKLSDEEVQDRQNQKHIQNTCARLDKKREVLNETEGELDRQGKGHQDAVTKIEAGGEMRK